MNEPTTNTLDVPGARLHYQVRGSGPVLLLIPGGPADITTFDAVAPLLAEHYTVVTYDPRGLSDSTMDDPTEEISVQTQADDAHRLLNAVGGRPAFVFGGSGGAITGLALVSAHPEQVRTLVAHEPPITDLLPNSDEHRAHNLDVQRTYRAEGIGPAMAKFMAGAGFDGPGPQPPQGEPDPAALAAMARMQANLELFLGPMWRPLGEYQPDIDALVAAPTRIVVGVGTTSEGQFAYRTGMLLAERLGQDAVVFPGDHGGITTEPAGYTSLLVTVFNDAD